MYTAVQGWGPSHDAFVRDFIFPAVAHYAKENFNERAFSIICKLFGKILHKLFFNVRKVIILYLAYFYLSECM